MANRYYAKGARRIVDADIDWTLANIKAVLVKGTYTPDTDLDEFYSDISAHVYGTPINVPGRVAEDGGIADASDLSFPIADGETVNFIVIFKDTGSPDTSPLILLFDTAPGLPATASGDGNVIVQWDNAGNKVFRI